MNVWVNVSPVYGYIHTHTHPSIHSSTNLSIPHSIYIQITSLPPIHTHSRTHLDHDEGVGHGFAEEDGAVVGRLVGGGVEELQELGAAEVELWRYIDVYGCGS